MAKAVTLFVGHSGQERYHAMHSPHCQRHTSAWKDFVTNFHRFTDQGSFFAFASCSTFVIFALESNLISLLTSTLLLYPIGGPAGALAKSACLADAVDFHGYNMSQYYNEWMPGRCVKPSVSAFACALGSVEASNMSDVY